MVLPSADWKNQPRRAFDWVIVAVGAVLAATYAYQWWTNGDVVYGGPAVVLVGWLLVYFTRLWQPILYLVASVTVGVVTVAWVVGGEWRQPINQVAILLNLAYIGLSVYLFAAEEPTA